MSGADRYEWERLVRRVRLGAPAKSVAAHLAQYADRDGTRVYPGATRLALVTELSERSVRGALKKLRERGWIERVEKGGHRGNQAFTDVYRLAIPMDAQQQTEMVDLDENPSPNRHQVPPGLGSQPAPGAAQPAGGAAQPAPDDIPTGTRCTPPTHLPTTYQTNYQRENSSYVTNSPSARDSEKRIVVPFDRRAL